MPPRGYTVASLQNLDPKTSSKSLSGKFSRVMFRSSGAAAREPQVTLLENTGRNFFSSLPGSIYDSPMCGNILPSLLNTSHRLFGSTWQPSLRNMFTTWLISGAGGDESVSDHRSRPGFNICKRDATKYFHSGRVCRHKNRYFKPKHNPFLILNQMFLLCQKPNQKISTVSSQHKIFNLSFFFFFMWEVERV